MQTGQWLIAILMAAYSVKAPAQELGGVSLPLGGTQAEVMAKLAQYRVEQAKGSTAAKGIWSVSDTTKWTDGPNLGNVGVVQFRNGRLVTVDRQWLDTRGNTDAMRIAINALRQLDGAKDCAISAEQPNSPDFSAVLLLISCNGHAISVGESDQPGGRYFHVYETWYTGANSP